METPTKILKISALGSDDFVLNNAANVLASAFDYAGKKSGIGEGFANPRQCKRAIKSGWDTVLVAVDEELSILGVLVGWVEEKNAIECVSLIGVAPKAMGKGLGKALMQACFARAEAAGKTSVRLTVNEHSTQSLPFYLSLGLQIKVTMCLFSTPQEYSPPNKRPAAVAEYKVRPITLESVGECCALMEAIVGFSKRSELESLVEKKCTGFQIMDASSNKIVGFMVANYSIAVTEDQWKHLCDFFLYSCGEYVPEIFVPVVYPNLIKFCYERGLNVYKKMHVMVKGEYFMDEKCIYCPSAEY